MPVLPRLPRFSPRLWTAVVLVLGAGLLILAARSGGGGAAPEMVWGRRGVRNGDLVKPRAIAIDSGDRLYLVDWTARIQVFNRDGTYRGPTWTTPD